MLAAGAAKSRPTRRQPSLTSDPGLRIIVVVMSHAVALAGGLARDVALVAAELARRNWAEANAGNLSFRLESRAGLTLLTKRAGFRMRELACEPGPGLCRVRCDARGRVRSVVPHGALPTSELSTHLAVHRVLARHRPRDRAVLHTHPTALVALSLLVPVPGKLVALLSRMHSEGPALITGRVAAIPFHLPGSDALARATARAFHTASAVIWPCHGIVSAGSTLAEALDLIEVVDKAADIALRLGERRIGRAGLSPAQERAVRRSAKTSG